ncbi:SED5-binding protein 3 [Candida viswanathii]|uniref:SED5-binding protein 3 n=1 Tax=Candida viswanathii TaxID=5486 RepID=A0A367XM31_9ASCO|nr:SED5-binding protein 3 [Candida viswanathii]
MSYFQPPQPQFGGPGTAPAAGQGINGNELSDNLQALDLNQQQSTASKKKSRRPARAFHTEFNSPVPSSTPVVSASPITPVFNPHQAQSNTTPVMSYPNQFPQASPLQVAEQHPLASRSTTIDQTLLQDISSFNQNNQLSLQEQRYHAQQEYITADQAGNYKSFQTFVDISPPDAGTQFHSIDQGNSLSKFMRSTLYYVPESEQLRLATKLPIAITVRPFAPLLKSEDPIQTVDFSVNDPHNRPEDPLSIGPIRCHRCRTYVNPSMQFTHNQRFVCNICQFSNNVVPPEYVTVLDGRGYRVDKFVKPELHKGVYDIVVPKEYNFGGPEKESHPLHVVFLVDISENSIKQSLPVLIADSIRATLYNYDPEEENGLPMDNPTQEKNTNTKIAIIAFDKRLHFFNLSPTLQTTQISISSDLEDPFVPFSEGLFVDPEESRSVIEDALSYIEQLCSSEKFADPEPCYSAAIQTAGMCLDMYGGGKIVSVLSALPSWGPGGLKYKDNKSIGRTAAPEVEKKLFTPDNEFYKALAKEFIEKSIGLDVHVVSHTPVDLSNVGWLASITGGDISRWANFNFERDGRALTAKIYNSVKNVTGYQGQLKLRCSNGLQVTQYYGTSSSLGDTTIIGNIQDPTIPVLTKDQAFTILLEYDGKLSPKLDCHFQAALLYTDPKGVRKVRVINLVLAVTKNLEDVFHFADESAVVTTIARDTLSFIGEQSLLELRESLNNKLVDIFTHYRAMNEYGHNRAKTLTNKMLFPDSLKHLPIYLLALLKTTAMRAATGLTSDARLADMYNMLNMPMERLMYHLYPALVELHSLLDEDALIDEPTGFTKVPLFKDLSFRNLDRGVYILCNGEKVFVWVDPDANVMLLKDVFGDNIESAKDIDVFMDELPELPTEISQQARNIVKFFQQEINGLPSLGAAGITIIRKTIDGGEFAFKELLKDDAIGTAVKTANGPSFAEYLTSLHKAVRVKLDSDKASQSIRHVISNVEHDNDTIAQRYIHF